MANDNNIQIFTAADIEKYHNGQLSPKEMHALEKAALDDPFLADALEGYTTAGVNVQEDIVDLRRRLTERTEQAKVIPLGKATKPLPWLRIAVLLVLIAGTGIISYQLLFNNRSEKNEVAQFNELKKAKADSVPATLKEVASEPSKNNSTTVSSDDHDGINDKLDSPLADRKIVKKEADQNREVALDSITYNIGISSATAPENKAIKPDAEKTDDYKEGLAKNVAPQKDDLAATEKAKAKQMPLKKPAAEMSDGYANVRDKLADSSTMNEVTISRRNDNAYRNTNIFRGRVTDVNNNALPFANITNTRDNVGTYTDAQGNFILISPDSTLNVQVKSLGFENNYSLLRNAAPGNRVVMQEDRSLNAKILDTVKRNLSRARKNIVTLEEPEPEDGWDSWDTYVVNNTNIPETFQKKTNEGIDNSVEVSFEVNKNGDPVNLKVEKSLCDKCDKEAVRLIKDGPKWKRKAKKTRRLTVTVPFVKPE